MDKPTHKKEIIVDHPHGEQRVEVRGKNLREAKGVQILGGTGSQGKSVKILDKRSNERGS